MKSITKLKSSEKIENSRKKKFKSKGYSPFRTFIEKYIKP